MGNSVIYRPAYDAEVEYLESTGTQWIDTGIVPTSDTSFEIEFQQVSFTYKYSPVAHCGEYYNSNDTFGFCIFNYTSTNGIASYYGTFSNIFVGNNFTNIGDRLNVKYRRGNTNIVLTNKSLGITDSNSLDTTFTNGSRTLYILYGNTETDDLRHPSAMKLYFCKIYNGSTLIRDFIPVRIGSIGYLYDKVTKQLFANKGTGNFILGNDVPNAVIPQQRCVLYFGNQRSVGFERIYEEYEWLVGDGTARMWCVIECNSAEWKLKGSGAASLDSHLYNKGGKAFQIVSDLQYIGGSGKIGIYDNTLTKYFSTTKLPINTIRLVMDTNVGSISINDTDFTNPDYTISRYFELANQLRDKNSANVTYSMSAIKIDDVARFFPCRLLRPIPAALDGNGIARQAGECGMWDKVSNRFYGNVANSGTFTVKGPKCYEEYKWLKVSVSRNVEMAALPVNSSNLYFKHKHISGINYHYFRATGEGVDYDYYYESDTHRCSVWNMSDMAVIYINQDITEDEIVINCNSSNRYVNGYNIPIYGSTIKHVSIISRNRNGFEGLISSITVNGSVRYVPCKLTHGIPASMDANGIARPAGTCGMWDKVNDKFYGNVASSGTFTVSND